MAAKGKGRGGKCVKSCGEGGEELVKRWEGVVLVRGSWRNDGKCVEEGKGREQVKEQRGRTGTCKRFGGVQRVQRVCGKGRITR